MQPPTKNLHQVTALPAIDGRHSAGSYPLPKLALQVRRLHHLDNQFNILSNDLPPIRSNSLPRACTSVATFSVISTFPLRRKIPACTFCDRTKPTHHLGGAVHSSGCHEWGVALNAAKVYAADSKHQRQNNSGVKMAAVSDFTVTHVPLLFWKQSISLCSFQQLSLKVGVVVCREQTTSAAPASAHSDTSIPIPSS